MENHTSLMLRGELGLKPGGTGINILIGAGWWDGRIEPKTVVGCTCRIEKPYVKPSINSMTCNSQDINFII